MTTIREAANVLAAHDPDSASERNEVGYNAADQWVKQLLGFPAWTFEQEKEVHEVIRKYRKQLAANGIDYDALVGEVDASQNE